MAAQARPSFTWRREGVSFEGPSGASLGAAPVAHGAFFLDAALGTVQYE